MVKDHVTPQANYLYEDDVHVTVNAKHLLSTANVTTEDKTAEIVGALASLARAGTSFARTEISPKTSGRLTSLSTPVMPGKSIGSWASSKNAGSVWK